MQGGGERNRERCDEKKGKTSSNNIERSYILELSEGHALERKNQGENNNISIHINLEILTHPTTALNKHRSLNFP